MQVRLIFSFDIFISLHLLIQTNTKKHNTMKATTAGAKQTPMPFNEWREYISRQIKFVECKKLMEEINQGADFRKKSVNVTDAHNHQ